MTGRTFRIVLAAFALGALTIAPLQTRADPKAGTAVSREVLQRVEKSSGKPVGNYWHPGLEAKRREIDSLIGRLKEQRALGPGPHYNGLAAVLTNLINKDGTVSPFNKNGGESAQWKGAIGSLNVAVEVVEAESRKLKEGERLVVAFETRDNTARGKEWAAAIYQKEFRATATDVRQTDVVVMVVRDKLELAKGLEARVCCERS